MNLRKSCTRAIRSSKFIWNHPLVKEERLMAFSRYFGFHLYSTFNNKTRIIPFIEKTSLALQHDLNGVCTNYYTYLADFEEMTFLLHFLRPKDVFCDIGSNVGTWSILASGVVGCRTIAVEPVRESFHKLLSNLDLNKILQKVVTINAAIGKDDRLVCISKGNGALNRILDNQQVSIESVRQKSLDQIINGDVPRLLKIDVEGYEMHIIKGGKDTFSNTKLQALIIELNGNSKKYGSSDDQIHNEISSYGFSPVSYDPFIRNLIPLNNYNTQNQNTIYVRDFNLVEDFINTSRKYQIGKYRI